MPGRTHPPRTTLPTDEFQADIYAQRHTTFEALRTALVKNGIVEHGLNPYEVIQRAIDDTTTDYLLTRQRIERDAKGNIKKFANHPLYDHMVDMREAAVRYSTFATQYDIQKRQLKLSESRIALLAITLRTTLQNLGMNPDQIAKVPQLLINTLSQNEQTGNPAIPKPNHTQANAIAEIMHRDAIVEVIDVTPGETDLNGKTNGSS